MEYFIILWVIISVLLVGTWYFVSKKVLAYLPNVPFPMNLIMSCSIALWVVGLCLVVSEQIIKYSF